MHAKRLIVLAIFLTVVPAFGRNRFGSGYNSYESNGNGYQGYNPGTGNTWNTNNSPTGSQGIDSRGNSWSYDRNSGVYQNYGTGRTRFNGR